MLKGGDLVDYNGTWEEKNCGGGEGGRQPPHCFTFPLFALASLEG